jgi:hypothetical protein
MHRSRVTVALALAVAGCFNPTYPDGVLACGEGGACPPGQTCDVDHVCRSTPADFAVEGGSPPGPPGQDLATSPDLAGCQGRCDDRDCMDQRCVWTLGSIGLVTNLAVDDTGVYFSNFNGSSVSVLARDLDGTNLRTYASGLATLGGIALDATNVYWLAAGSCGIGSADGALNEVPKANPSAGSTQITGSLVCPSALVRSSGTLFWGQAATGIVHYIGVGGGAAQQFTTSLGQVYDLVSDDTRLCWIGYATPGAVGSGEVQCKPSGGSPDSTWSSVPSPGTIALHAGYAYWTQMPDHYQIVRAAMGGGAPATLLDLGTVPAYSLAPDGARVYFTSTDGSLRSVATDGSGRSTTIHPGNGPGPFTIVQVYGDYVYFTVSTGQQSGVLMKAEKLP